MHITTVRNAYTTYIKENQAAPKNVDLEPKRKFNRKTAYVDVDGYYCCHTCGKPLCSTQTADKNRNLSRIFTCEPHDECDIAPWLLTK